MHSDVNLRHDLQITVEHLARTHGATENSSDANTVDFQVPEGLVTELFDIERPLGRGGMGEVYLAIEKNLNRLVALKLLRGSNDIIQVQRLLSEARHAAQIHAPNVVVIYSSGDTELPYIAMEYLKKGSLSKRLSSEQRLSPIEALQIIRGCACGLAAAHNIGVVHLDVKPDNILMGDDGTPKLADFGLSRFVTVDDVVVSGTPSYMSPEQARGRGLDKRSDIYALGATFYELVSGVRLFGDIKDTFEILLAQVEKQPTPLLELVPSLPKVVDEIISKCLEKNPDVRYQSMEELIVDIDRAIASLTKKPLYIRIVSNPYVFLMTTVLFLLITGALIFFTRPQEDPVSIFSADVAKEIDLSKQIEMVLEKFLEQNTNISRDEVLLVEENGQIDLRFKKGSKVTDCRWLLPIADKLTVFVAQDCGITDVSFLSRAGGLKILDLSFNAALSDLSYLNQLMTKEVYLRGTGVTSLEFLRGDNALEVLVVNNTPLKTSDFEAVNLSRIKKVIASGDEDLIDFLMLRCKNVDITVF